MVKKISIAIIDTYEDKYFPRVALEKCIRSMDIECIHTFSNAPIIQGETFHQINTIKSIAEYSDIVINVLPYFVNEDYLLIVQWDGFILNPEFWNDDFLEYDYIGAPWPNRDSKNAGGNGGFSLRSRKFLEIGKKVGINPLQNDANERAEDVLLCDTYYEQLRTKGIEFAPAVIAKKFSSEFPFSPNTFGFHGVFNFPFIFDEQFLMQNLHKIIFRLKDVNALYLLINNSIDLKYFDFMRKMDELLIEDGNYLNIKNSQYIREKSKGIW